MLEKMQDGLKRYGRLYYSLLKIFAPVYGGKTYKKIGRILKEYDELNIILNLGSGPVYFGNRTDIINADIFAFDEVDIVADCEELPVENGTVDMISMLACLNMSKILKLLYMKCSGCLKLEEGLFVSFHVGTTRDTSEFAVDSVRTWWSKAGSNHYPNADHLLILADCGGSNGYRARLWKQNCISISATALVLR